MREAALPVHLSNEPLQPFPCCPVGGYLLKTNENGCGPDSFSMAPVISQVLLLDVMADDMWTPCPTWYLTRIGQYHFLDGTLNMLFQVHDNRTSSSELL
jgi:hypothetical protein